ncbi:MAG: hypothetical protein KF901_31205 [Myxococcales bacterium]|nr:hypothetical protein [Myxococcales bacterium]
MLDLETRVRDLEAKLAERDAQLADRDAQLAERDAQLAEQAAKLVEQAAQLEKLEKQLAKLTGQLKRNSSNSASGGAPSRSPALTRGLWPCSCGSCGRTLGREAEGEPERRQHIEVPPVRAIVLEGRAYAVRCSCGTITKAEFSQPFGPRPFGVKPVATLAVLVGVFRLSRRQVQYFARTFFGVELVRQHERLGGGPGGLRPTGEGRSPSETKLALGTISKLEQEASDALAPVYTEALDAARASEAALRFARSASR